MNNINPPYRIMYVEDSRTQAAHLKALLTQEGWEVLWVPNGENAIEQIGEFVPDLILVDYHLPGILGDEVCRQVRMRIDTRVIAVIMLTADDEKEVEARGLESGADDFVRKSNDNASLLLRVRTLLKRSRTNLSILNPKEQLFNRPRLLAVDDSITFLTHLTQELSKEAYRFETVTNAPDAMKRLSSENFDCVLVDMVMPDTDGITLCKQIDELRRDGLARLSILVLTANDDKEGLMRALDAGADDFVGKSSDISVLKVRIRASLRRKFYEEENRRIIAELKDKELEAERERIEKEAAITRASMTDQLARVNEELKRLTYVGHHHMQQPLRTAASYCQLMQKRYGGKIDSQADRFMSSAINAVSNMKHLLGDLLDYSTLVSPDLITQEVNCAAIVHDAYDKIMKDARDDQVLLTCGTLPVIVGDENQITKLFSCLIQNAVIYRGIESVKIHIDAEPFQQHQESGWRFSITDNGFGIDKEVGDRIFSIFERLHTETEFPGTGMGLAMCKKIAEAHQGRIWFESTVGQGTTFYVDLPDKSIESHESSSNTSTLVAS